LAAFPCTGNRLGGAVPPEFQAVAPATGPRGSTCRRSDDLAVTLWPTWRRESRHRRWRRGIAPARVVAVGIAGRFHKPTGFGPAFARRLVDRFEDRLLARGGPKTPPPLGGARGAVGKRRRRPGRYRPALRRLRRAGRRSGWFQLRVFILLSSLLPFQWRGMPRRGFSDDRAERCSSASGRWRFWRRFVAVGRRPCGFLWRSTSRFEARRRPCGDRLRCLANRVATVRSSPR